jgi:hypothetical protein
MKKHLIIVLSLIGILSSFQVFAQAGWVLWTYTTHFKVNQEAKTFTPSWKWDFVDAYPSYNQCMAMKEERWKGRVRVMVDSGICKDAPDLVRGESYTCRFEKGGSVTVDFKCIPSTIDPREKE